MCRLGNPEKVTSARVDGRKSADIMCPPLSSLATEEFRRHDAGWSSPVAREAHNLEVAGSNPVPAILDGRVESQPRAHPGKTGVFSCAGRLLCGLLRLPACAGCAAFCATLESSFSAASKCASVVIRSCCRATRGVFPNQRVTTCTGKGSTNSVSRLARRLWNNRGQIGRPARPTIFWNVVRRLAFSQPAGPIAALRNLSSTTNSASSAASSKDSVNIGRSFGKSGISRFPVPG